MAYLLAEAILIPVILTIWTYNPLWELEQEVKEEDIEIDISQDNRSPIIFLVIFLIWLLLLGRIFYLLRKRAYTLRTKF